MYWNHNRLKFEPQAFLSTVKSKYENIDYFWTENYYAY